MATSYLSLPPVTQDLWPVLRDRLKTTAMTGLWGGANRSYFRDDPKVDPKAPYGYPAPEAAEGVRWARSVIVPVLPAGGIRWEPGLPVRLRFLHRVDVNVVRSSAFAARTAELVQHEGARLLHEFEPVLVSTQIMLVGPVQLEEWWSGTLLKDPDVTGTGFLSSSYLVDCASAAD